MEHRIDADILIVGGGPAGLSAALVAGRARRSVVVIDQGNPRHAVSPGVHNFLTREGMPPADLRRIAWEQLAAFPGVSLLDARVTRLSRVETRWVADCGDRGTVTARAALLATGVVDLLPTWPGFRRFWGRSVHFCPYCHGWEMRDQPLATFGHGEAIAHFGPLLAQWSRDVVVIEGDTPLSTATRDVLDRHEITVQPGTIAQLEGTGHQLSAIQLADGTVLQRQGLFIAAPQRQVPMVQALDLATTPHPLNADGLVKVDPHQQTSAPMLWAAGDVENFRPQVVEAAAAGGRAGAMMHAVLALGALPHFGPPSHDAP